MRQQKPVWPDRDSWTVQQAKPPLLGSINPLRVSAWAPPSQSLLQAESPGHLESAQIYGAALHPRVHHELGWPRE